MRFIVVAIGLGAFLSVSARSTPISNAASLASEPGACMIAADYAPADFADIAEAPTQTAPDASQTGTAEPAADPNDHPKDPVAVDTSKVPVDANGVPVPLERQQPQRILGFMPNFRSVSGGSKPHPPGWKYNFTVATRQATDYSSFIFLGLTSLTAKGIDEHPALGKGPEGLWAYTWRGFLDKTDGTYLSAWLLPSLIHEDTRNFALGNEHSILVRELYVISRQGVARTYGGHQTPNIAGLGGKVLTQIVSRQYYPKSATTFPVLAEKFGYSAMRDVIFTSIREFYPDIAAHYIRKHREKMDGKAAALQAAIDAH